MVLSRSELLGALQNEVHILLHLASKIDPMQLDYRPTPKQRSSIELLRYLSVMGPMLVEVAKNGIPDDATIKSAIDTSNARDFEQTVAEIAKHKDAYASLLAGLSDADLRGEMDWLGSTMTRGAFIINFVLCGCAAYRTQLFLYLKACGRDELTTMDLWLGVDGPATV